jgi:serine protease
MLYQNVDLWNLSNQERGLAGRGLHLVPLLASLLLGACSSGAPKTLAVNAPDEAYEVTEEGVIKGNFVLRLREGIVLDDSAVRAVLEDLDADDLRAVEGLDGAYRFKSQATLNAVEDIQWLNPAFEFIEPMIQLETTAAITDPYAVDYQWHLGELDIADSWDTSRGEGVVVAVVDSGVYRFEDEATCDAKVDPLCDELPYDGIENLLPQREIAPTVNLAWDDNGHGTHIASTIAQRANNDYGGAGIAPEATILPVRVMNTSGTGSSADIAEGILFAVDSGAHIINLSLGSSMYSAVIADACQIARDQGILVIASTGNDGFHHLKFPAALESTLAVGAIGSDGWVTPYSNTGAGIDVVAPGGMAYDLDRNGMIDGILAETIWQTEDGYTSGHLFNVGTSMAAATVSGVAALLMGAGATADEARALLTSTAIDIGESGYDVLSGHGLINAQAALEAYEFAEPHEVIDNLLQGDLLVTEIMANPSWCARDLCEWVEIYNTRDVNVNLRGLVFSDSDDDGKAIEDDLLIHPGEYLVFARGRSSSWDHPDFTPDGFYGRSLSLGNSGDQLFIANDRGIISASLPWGNIRGEAGVSMELTLGLDPADPASWTSSEEILQESGEFGTPGVPQLEQGV